VRTTITTAVLAAAVALAGCSSQGGQDQPEGDQAGAAATVPAPTTTNRYAGNPQPQSVGKPFLFDLAEKAPSSP
jgi:hypothetical protein